MWAGPRYLLVFGGACPSVTSLIARSLPALQLVQVSFAPTSPSLSNRKWYGNLFSTAPSDRALNQATVKLLQRFRWSRVGVLTQEGPRLSEMKKDLLKQLVKAEVHVVSAESVSEDMCSRIRNLKENDARIIIALMDQDSASDVFCCAYRLNLFGPRIQWLVLGGAAGWRLQASGCTDDSLETAADGSIMLQTRHLSRRNTAGTSGRSPQAYLDSYLSQVDLQQRSEVSPSHAFAYDAVWVAAQALSQVMEAAKHQEKYGVQRNVSAGPEDVHLRLKDALRRTQMEGVTGPVSFRSGERMTTIELIQVQGGSGVMVGDFSTSSQQLRVMKHLLRFKGPGPARDRTQVLLQRRGVDLPLYAAVSSAAAATVIAMVTVLCLTTFHWRHRQLRSSSGSQDELLLLGLLLSSSSVLVSGLDTSSVSMWTFELFCSLRLWTLSVGHTVGLAVLFTKSWRLYSLCSIRHRRAVCVVIWMLLLDVFVLISWQMLDPLRRVVLQHSQSESADQDVMIRLVSESCSSSNTELWLTAVFGYKAALMGLGCFVAWGIRCVQVHREHLSLSVFALMVFSVSGVAASLLTSHDPPLQFTLTSAVVLCCNIFILSCMFGPKLLHWRMNGGEDEEEDDEEQLIILNLQLKNQTAQLDAEIENLSMKLCQTADPDTKTHNETKEKNNGDLRSASLTHLAQVRSDDRRSTPASPDAVNRPEHVLRRLSVQLPILHHSYLPLVGGVRASSSSLYGSHDAFLTATFCSTNTVPANQRAAVTFTCI